jgi:5-(carboxyamino)imidazole ribonucleotide mutase
MSSAGAGPLVGVIMGSDSDLPVLQGAVDVLGDFAVPCEVRIVSAHRTPDVMMEYGRSAAGRGLRVIIAGAGGAAHLPGMTASYTSLPVIGVPVPLAYLDGVDSLLSIVQMPAGVPVAAVGIGNARNAGLLAVRILATSDPALRDALDRHRDDTAAAVREKDDKLQSDLPSPS